MIRTFKDLFAWQKGHELVLSVYDMTKRYPKDEQFGLASQMRRAAVSITSNIAEGFGRSSYREKQQFYSIARGSLTELQNQLLVSRDVGYIPAALFERTDALAVEVSRIIQALSRGSKKMATRAHS